MEAKAGDMVARKMGLGKLGKRMQSIRKNAATMLKDAEAVIDDVLGCAIDADGEKKVVAGLEELEDENETALDQLRVYVHVHSASGLLRNGKAKTNMDLYCTVAFDGSERRTSTVVKTR
jgi:hypothetical protein